MCAFEEEPSSFMARRNAGWVDRTRNMNMDMACSMPLMGRQGPLMQRAMSLNRFRSAGNNFRMPHGRFPIERGNDSILDNLSTNYPYRQPSPSRRQQPGDLIVSGDDFLSDVGISNFGPRRLQRTASMDDTCSFEDFIRDAPFVQSSWQGTPQRRQMGDRDPRQELWYGFDMRLGADEERYYQINEIQVARLREALKIPTIQPVSPNIVQVGHSIIINAQIRIDGSNRKQFDFGGLMADGPQGLRGPIPQMQYSGGSDEDDMSQYSGGGGGITYDAMPRQIMNRTMILEEVDECTPLGRPEIARRMSPRRFDLSHVPPCERSADSGNATYEVSDEVFDGTYQVPAERFDGTYEVPDQQNNATYDMSQDGDEDEDAYYSDEDGEDEGGDEPGTFVLDQRPVNFICPTVQDVDERGRPMARVGPRRAGFFPNEQLYEPRMDAPQNPNLTPVDYAEMEPAEQYDMEMIQ